MAVDILSRSLMMHQGKPRFIYHSPGARCFNVSRNSMPWWRDRRRSVCKLIMAGNTPPKDSRLLCVAWNIRHDRIELGTLQHNSVAKKINQTIREKVRCMLRMAKLSMPLCGEVVNITCYYINRSPSVPLEYNILQRAWVGKNLSYPHLKISDCKALCACTQKTKIQVG